ncbi:MAG: hypothetical protein KatS3mg104_0681 [Phycisphaerae bacterium]|nr:MAG: hypothetical protein KatS3mg104_0681 [Phycisphaerae bacterium]
MANRLVHYEAAFEEYLRSRKIPYVAVDEAKKTLFADASLKSFDFVVYSSKGPNLLVDVKGRKARTQTVHRGYESWTTQQDVEDLVQWQEVFGTGFCAILAFVYWIEPPLLPEASMFEFKERWYQLMGIDLNQYRHHMRRRSPKWGTVCLSREDFHQLARPIETWL